MAGTNVGTAYVTIMPSTKGISGSISKALKGEASGAGSEAGNLIGGNLVGTLKKVIIGAGIGAVVKKIFKEALDAAGNLEQSFGGLDTIYGDAAENMKKMSYEAAQAGISANTYAEQAVSFGAALRQAFGGDMVKAAEAADTAIMDMADNAAKMGTPIESIQQAYQGFARGQYQLLDNLKLGYGGTKEEMERLLADAEKLTGIKYDISNLGDVYAAIHVIQGELGITGVAAQEGAETFKGSMAAMKASAENLLANLALGEDIKEPLKSLVSNTKNFLVGNLFPMIGNVLKALPGLIGDALKWAFTNIPNMVESAKEFLTNLTESIKNNSGVVAEGLAEIGQAFLDMIQNTDWLGLGASILNLIWTGIQEFAPILWDAILSIGETAAEWFQNVDWAAVGQTVIQLIGDGLGYAGEFLWEVIQTIAAAAVEWWEGIDWSTVGQDAFNMLVEGLKNVGSLLWEALKGIAETAAEHFQNTDVDWSAVGQKVLTMIGEGIGAYARFIWEAVSNIGATAKEWFENVDWSQAGYKAMDAIINGIKWLATNIPQALKTIATTAAQAFKDVDWRSVGINVLEFIGDGLIAMGEFLWGVIKRLGEEALNAFLSMDWVQTGIDIVYGIIDGITSAGGMIADTLIGYAQDAWNSVIGFFGIGSPSKLMRDTVGKWIPLGMAEGIEEEANAVTKAMDDMAKSAVEDFSINADYNAIGTSASGLADNSNTTINVYASPGMDINALADEIQQRLALIQRQKQAAWGTA